MHKHNVDFGEEPWTLVMGNAPKINESLDLSRGLR